MNELKPEDVMRALECCDRGSSCRCDCDNCPYYRCDVPCKDKVHTDALALLREKDAEIKELTDDNKWSAKRIIETDKLVSLLKAEVERLTKERDDARSDCAVAEQNHYECKKELETTRSEAITEFAGMLKEAVKHIPWCDYPQVHRCIDEIAEKMKGEEDGNLDL